MGMRVWQSYVKMREQILEMKRAYVLLLVAYSLWQFGEAYEPLLRIIF